MATIDKLDMSVYNLYAVRTKMIEQIHQELRIKESQGVPAHATLFDLYPKLSELDLILGVTPVVTPWAYFYPPKKFRTIRKSPFAFFRIIPSLGTLEEQEEQEARLNDVQTRSSEEEEEKKAIAGCLGQIEKINSWMSYIIGRVGQFLQG
jgi:hypothetical protein